MMSPGNLPRIDSLTIAVRRRDTVVETFSPGMSLRDIIVTLLPIRQTENEGMVGSKTCHQRRLR